MKKMLTESKKLNIAIILFIIVNVIAIIIGTLYSILGLMPYHRTSLGMSPSKINSFNPNIMPFIYIIIRVNGFLFLTSGINGLIVIYYGIRNKEKWAWLYNLVAFILISIPLVVLLYNETFAMPFPLALFVFIIWLIGLGISYKEIFG